MSNKTTKAQRAAAAANGAAILSNAGFTFRTNRAATIATLREVTGWKPGKNKAGEFVTIISDDARDAFLRGDMAARLNPAAAELTPAMLAEAKEVLTRRAATSKPRQGEILRTAAQDKMYGAARTALSALLLEAEIRTNQKRGGARAKAAPAELTGVEKASIEADKANEAAAKDAASVAKTPAAAHAYVVQQAGTLMMWADKNKATVSEAARKIVIAFHKAAMALPAG